MAGGRAILAGFAALLAVPVALEAQTSGQAQTQSGGGYYDMGDYTYFNQRTAPTPTPTPTPKPSVTSAPALSVTHSPTQSTAQAAVRAQAVQQPSAQIQGQPYVFPKGDLDKARADAKALAKPARASAASLPTSTPLTSVPGYSPAANPAEAYADDPDGLTAAGNAAVGSNEAWKMVTDPDRVKVTLAPNEITRAQDVEKDPNSYLDGQSMGATDGSCKPLPPSGSTGYYEASCNSGTKVEEGEAICRTPLVVDVIPGSTKYIYTCENWVGRRPMSNDNTARRCTPAFTQPVAQGICRERSRATVLYNVCRQGTITKCYEPDVEEGEEITYECDSPAAQRYYATETTGQVVNERCNEAMCNAATSGKTCELKGETCVDPEADSQLVSRATQTTGDANAGIEALAKVWKNKFADVSAKGGLAMRLASIASENTGRTVSGDQALGEMKEYLTRETNSTQAKAARDEFFRETSSSGDSEVRSLSQKLGVSVGESRSASLEATRAEETFQRVSNDVREASSRGWSLSRNETQEFVTYAQERLLQDDNLSQSGWTPGMVMPRTREQEQVRDILLGDFMERRVAEVRNELGVSVPEHLRGTLHGPASTTAAGVRQWGGHRAANVAAQGPDVSIRESSRDHDLAGEVSDAIPNASARITRQAFEIGNQVDDAKDTAGRLGDHVRERNDAWIPATLPGVEGARDWARDTLGMGQGTSHVYELPRGERATLPISGRLSSNMGGRIDPVTGQPGHHHRGVDIAAALGTEIRAPASGRVVKNDFQGGGAGNYLVLQHGDGSQSKYFHMQDRSAFPVGSNIEAGSVLGRVGSTGKSTGPHLHYELWKDGRPVDPKRFQLRNAQE